MKILPSTLMFILIAGVASAQSEADVPSFRELDTDADGRLSTTEAQADARVSAQFQKADTDQDGYLSLKEFIAIWR